MVVTISVCALVGMLLLDVYSEFRLRTPHVAGRIENTREDSRGIDL